MPDAASNAAKPGDCAVVERAGVRRQLVVCCPNGCGDLLSINFDPRSGAVDVLAVCRGLVRRGVLEEGLGKQRGVFSVKGG
jgi:hypothetical protein